MLAFKRVAVGLSGGVDSAVAALLLKQKGYLVEGVFMQNWDIADETGHCSANEDYKDAAWVCNQLNIKLHHVNFVKEYWNEVFCNTMGEYQTGLTPNPDILCNRNVKFKYFYKHAIGKLGMDAIATGHYAKTSFGPYLQDYEPDTKVRLLRAEDSVKDQTFFLCQVEQEALQKTMFPLGTLTKRTVKQIARDHGLDKIVKKKESMGICFIGCRNFQKFIQEYIPDKPGDFVDIDTGLVVGKHGGFHQWTVGQRARISGVAKPYFIARKVLENNNIYIAQTTNQPILHSNLIFTCKPHWIHSRPAELESKGVLECLFKFQHTKPYFKSEVYEVEKGLIINVSEHQRAVTPGQYAVLVRDGGECIGSAKIINPGVSHFSLYYLQNRQIENVTEILNKFRKVDDKCNDELNEKLYDHS